jgi:hypothetical protein
MIVEKEKKNPKEKSKASSQGAPLKQNCLMALVCYHTHISNSL